MENSVTGKKRVRSAIALSAMLLAANARAQVGQFENRKESPKGRVPSTACIQLRSLTGYDFAVDTASIIPAHGDVPEFCLVQGLITPEVRFEVALPKDWNGRLYMFGNGGFAGESLSSGGRVNTRNNAIKRGFAVASTNTGHEAAREPLATFAGNPQKLVDYAYRAVHVTALTAKTLIRAYYDSAAAKSYFVGCSTGGRQGLISAQRFPDDFDGIVVGAPVLDFTGTMVHYVAFNRALASAGLSAEKVGMLGEKIYAKCDAADGLKDGLITDPRRCQFDPATDVPQCTTSTDGGACLTDAHVKALRTVYGGASSKGVAIFPGFPVGGEAVVQTPAGQRSGWIPWIIGDGQQPTISAQFMESFFKEMVTPGTPIDWREFDPDRDIDKLTRIGTLLNAKDPDLTRFHARGGKILMYFGWADPALNPMMGVNYYEQMRQTMGSRADEFFRLVMLPGVLHCTGGLGPSQFDSITPLVDWVEHGTAPDRLVSTLRQEGKPVRSRPLCVYPMSAKYNGSGNVDDAANFSCAAPK
jgi:Tannase and feruloyl esterase